MAYKLVTGDTSLVIVTLKENDVLVDLTGMTVKARLVPCRGGDPLTDVWTLSAGTPGADWPNGKVAIQIPGAATEDINTTLHDTVSVEIQANDGTYDKTWFASIETRQGSIL